MSSSAEDETCSLTVNIIKAIADRLKNPKAACTENSKSSRMQVLSQTNRKLFHAGGLKPRDIPSGMAILVSAVRRRYGLYYQFILQQLYICNSSKAFLTQFISITFFHITAVNIIADIDKVRRQRYNNNYRKVINRQRRTYENIFYPPRRDRVEQP